eukprot:gene53340-72890_t
MLLGCPLLGDPVYGDGTGPLHLLARAIRLHLDPPVAAEAPVPPHMRAALAHCAAAQHHLVAGEQAAGDEQWDDVVVEAEDDDG